jgi:hypothetical protein
MGLDKKKSIIKIKRQESSKNYVTHFFELYG